MIVHIFYLVLFLIFTGTMIVVIWLFSRRYERKSAIMTVSIVALFSLILSVIVFRSLDNKALRPVGDWHSFNLSEPAVALHFRPEGLYAETENHQEVQLVAGNLPRCEAANLLPTHPEMQAQPPKDVPNSQFPTLPGIFSQQMSIGILYPEETDASGVVSFGIDQFGQIWCTEQFSRGGPSGFINVAAVATANLFISIIFFAILFVGGNLLALIILELRYRRNPYSQ